MVTDAKPAVHDALSPLLEGCARHREESLRELYQATSAQLFAVLLRALRVHRFAEEALQNTYSVVWHSAHAYRSELGSPLTWMLAIARHEARAVLRGQNVLLDQTPGSTIEALAANLTHANFKPLDHPSKQCLVALYCEGFSLQALAENFSEPATATRDRVRATLRLMSESDDE